MFLQIDATIIFDWKYLVVFLTGILIGFFLLFLVYLSSVFMSLKKKKKYQNNPIEIDENEIRDMIIEAQEKFKNEELRQEVGFFNYYKNINFQLINNIAGKYYPESKYPYLELTVDESIDLINYIASKIEEQLKGRFLVQVKKVKLTIIGKLLTKKPEVVEEKTNKVTQKFKNFGKWAKRKTVDKAIEFFGFRLSLKIIGIIGEETYKIYSKSVFQEPEDLQIDIEGLYDED